MTDQASGSKPASNGAAWPWILVATVVSASALGAVVWWVGPQKLWQRISQLAAWPLIGACVAYVGAHTVRTLRLGVLVPDARGPSGLSVVATHSFANQLLPARSGELAFPALLNKLFDSPAGAGASYLLVIRFAELTALVALQAVAVVVWLTFQGDASAKQVALGGLGLAVLASVLFVASKQVLTFIARFFRWLLSFDAIPDWRLFEFLRDAAPDAESALEEVTPGQWRQLTGWSFAMWGAMFTVFSLSLTAADVELGLAATIVGAAGGIIGNLLSVVGFGSLGTMEAGWTAGYVAVGAELVPAAAAGFAVHAIVIIGSATLAVAAAAATRLSDRTAR